ncbi:MAG: hypothetical protein A4E56_01773 [Pelotomaculum sp. PtaU1.Bin065]|nr:MAG: hypothetical protein A4E56_01773 [Pelotomaculum sp. PtaU1.Bin065]
MQLLKSATALQPAADGGNQVSDNSAVLQMAIEVDDQSHEEDNGRAHHVTATVYGETLEQGANQPSVDPEGWDELKGDSAYNTENLVRMHLWNGRLGGPGDKKWNLTPGESDFNLHEMSPVETEMQSEVDEGNIVTIDTTVTYGNMEEPLYYYPTHVNLSWASFDGENGDAQNEGELDEDVPALEEEDGEWLPDSSGNESEE